MSKLPLLIQALIKSMTWSPDYNKESPFILLCGSSSFWRWTKLHRMETSLRFLLWRKIRGVNISTSRPYVKCGYESNFASHVMSFGKVNCAQYLCYTQAAIAGTRAAHCQNVQGGIWTWRLPQQLKHRTSENIKWKQCIIYLKQWS